jgi:hypothetical protein
MGGIEGKRHITKEFIIPTLQIKGFTAYAIKASMSDYSKLKLDFCPIAGFIGMDFP